MTPADAALVDHLPPAARRDNGVPTPERAAAMEAAVEEVRRMLGPVLADGGLRTSVLGPGWSQDLDVHLAARPDDRRLADAGWVPLGPLLSRLGWREAEGQWALVREGRMPVRVDLHPSPPPDPVDAVVRRCRRRGAVRLREVLELRHLQREGHRLPDDAVVHIAARAEAALGGNELAPWLDASPILPPVPVPGARRRLRRLAGLVRSRRRYRVALSGVDGSGKSSLSERLVEDLGSLGIPAARVWTRPGMRVGWLASIARAGKRLLGEDPAPGVQRIGTGTSAGELSSRRGLLGSLWALAVTSAFLVDVRRQLLGARGIVIFDRHALDALVTLEFVYQGASLAAPRALVRALLPPADLRLYLDVPSDVAVERKQDDLFGPSAVARQLEVYRRLLAASPAVIRIDAGRSPEDVADDVLRLLLAGPVSR